MNNIQHKQKDWDSLWAQMPQGKRQLPHPSQKAPTVKHFSQDGKAQTQNQQQS